jgi:hypothetical protein
VELAKRLSSFGLFSIPLIKTAIPLSQGFLKRESRSFLYCQAEIKNKNSNMKKLIAGLGMILILMLFKTSAQVQKAGAGQLILPAVQLVEGRNAVALPGGCTLQFEFKGNAFSNFSFLDSLGAAHLLSASNATVSAPRPVCQSNQVRESYASSQKDIGVCLCKPNPPASGATNLEYHLTIDMPIASNKTKAGKAQNRRVEVKLSK